MNGTRVMKVRGVLTPQRLSGLRDDQGLTTAEYAVGTVAVAGLGGVLIKLLTSEAVRDLIWKVVQGAFAAMLGA